MDPKLVLVLVVTLVIGIRLAAGSMDRARIDGYLRQRRCKLLHSQWTPFGRGWFGERSDRIYAIRYRDAHGGLHRATVKTSMWTGVYLTDDEMVAVVRDAAEVDVRSASELRRDNERLRAEVERLRRRS